ncbi:Metallo-beta-lactamase superfamily protein [Singulisphaera sp. GP187]|uniref:ComEC/Rec2 family competence protein n=1 Tax=Singulisphaera sp. GP187 TaxID=1882752 RepID=UPI00092A718A|nr:MBL fold metallo-hydrolase [Singulisphaera sp. GP187]SIN72259.1 Metallo-beta-lactamase superfamily protein [Singulisphaera sp. GP187]
MTQASGIEKASLEVHILGGGQGESIVIRMPDGRWGVVDCFTTSPDSGDYNSTALFLRAHEVPQLHFVCLTHPHQDHFMGMAELLEEFRPREFWRFGSLSHEHINNLIHYYEAKAIVKGQSEFSRTADELLALFGKSLEGVQSNTMNVEYATGRASLYPPAIEGPKQYHIESLSPTGNQAELYQAAIIGCVTPEGKLGKKLTRTHHNNISVVLKLTYGKTVVFLGGDLEKKGWEELLGRYADHMLKATAVKVSHHGSPNGYCDQLWERFCWKDKPVAVVTPSNHHQLPKESAVTHIKQHASAVYSTCTPWNVSDAPAPEPESSQQSLKSLGALLGKMSAVLAPSRPTAGCCSLIFDDEGGCTVYLTRPAQKL